MKKYYAAIDTNVLVSALLKSGSNPWLILDLIKDGTIIPIISDDILTEYRDVLFRQKFKFPIDAVMTVIEGITDKGLLLSAEKTNISLPDPDDVVFYEVVMESQKSNKDSYLVTGNVKHFPKKPFVVTPSEMLEIIKINK